MTQVDPLDIVIMTATTFVKLGLWVWRCSMLERLQLAAARAATHALEAHAVEAHLLARGGPLPSRGGEPWPLGCRRNKLRWRFGACATSATPLPLAVQVQGGLSQDAECNGRGCGAGEPCEGEAAHPACAQHAHHAHDIHTTCTPCAPCARRMLAACALQDNLNDVLTNSLAIASALAAASLAPLWVVDPIAAILLSLFIIWSWVRRRHRSMP